MESNLSVGPPKIQVLKWSLNCYVGPYTIDLSKVQVWPPEVFAICITCKCKTPTPAPPTLHQKFTCCTVPTCSTRQVIVWFRMLQWYRTN